MTATKEQQLLEYSVGIGQPSVAKQSREIGKADDATFGPGERKKERDS